MVADLEDGRIVLWNPAAEALFGFAAEHATGPPLEVLIPDEFKVAHRQRPRADRADPQPVAGSRPPLCSGRCARRQRATPCPG
ncbi:MAG: PAS domain-containing protein [Chloroflexi bacterium]|nr:PAS domain-containing protein [Chloroflexota bacterium]